MGQYIIVNLGKLLELNGEVECNDLLSSFICSKNKDVQHYLTHNAIEFNKQRVAMTYLVYCLNDSKLELVGYYTLANKCVSVPLKNISKTLQKKISKFAQYDEIGDSFQVPMPLIGQLGKDDLHVNVIEGDVLLEMALTKVREAQDIIGGKTTYIECSSEPKLEEFYKKNSFVWFGKNKSDKSGTLDQMIYYDSGD